MRSRGSSGSITCVGDPWCHLGGGSLDIINFVAPVGLQVDFLLLLLLSGFGIERVVRLDHVDARSVKSPWWGFIGYC